MSILAGRRAGVRTSRYGIREGPWIAMKFAVIGAFAGSCRSTPNRFSRFEKNQRTLNNTRKIKMLMRPYERAILWLSAVFILLATGLHAQDQPLYYYGSTDNDLYQLLRREGFTIREFGSASAAITAAPAGSGVLVTPAHYPDLDPANAVSRNILDEAKSKHLRLYVEYPSGFPGLDIPSTTLETHLERGVVTADVFPEPLQTMSLLGINNCHVLKVDADSPLIVLAKVVGVDKAVYGLANTPYYPLLFQKEGVLLAMTAFSHFQRGRYGPQQSIQSVMQYILGFVQGRETGPLTHWLADVQPMYGRAEALPPHARLRSVQRGVHWFESGRFLLDPSWKADWVKYGSNGLQPIGPPVPQSHPSGDGSLGILEGHTSTILYNGEQRYRYWIRADVQGEASMALAAAGTLLHNDHYKQIAAHLLEFLFRTSNLRSGNKSDPRSPVYGLIGWATTNSGSFYGDDNARAILGAIGASGYLGTNTWNTDIAAAIMANFRTTGKEGFRGDRLEAGDIIKNGWPYYYHRDLVNPSPHFESWLWACYLWLYDKTGYKPLLARTEKAIRTTMNDYPDQWRWGSSMQTQRARMILPLAWLVRVDDTEEHRSWLDKMVKELLRYQDSCGAIREELGQGAGMFKALKKNDDYGSDEGSLIFRNGQQISCMLYTNNFALFGLHEAAEATGNSLYRQAAGKLADFLVRIQVKSEIHQDLDGAWFRAFDYGKWDYWASNSDAGWGAWCTLTGWIQSWILTAQTQVLQESSFWDVSKSLDMKATGHEVISQMMALPD